MSDVGARPQGVTLSVIEASSPVVKAWLPYATSLGSLTLGAEATATSLGRHLRREPKVSDEKFRIRQAKSSGVQTT